MHQTESQVGKMNPLQVLKILIINECRVIHAERENAE